MRLGLVAEFVCALAWSTGRNSEGKEAAEAEAEGAGTSK
jgi:hypothetical protein